MAMIQCPECGKEISDKARKCIHCGKVLIEDKPQTKVCNECGKENSIDVTECAYCGCPFEEVVTPTKESNEKSKRNKKKIIIPAVAIVLVVVIGIVIYNMKVIKPKNTYNECSCIVRKR